MSQQNYDFLEASTYTRVYIPLFMFHVPNKLDTQKNKNNISYISHEFFYSPCK